MTTRDPFQPALLYDSVFNSPCIAGYIIFLINKKIYVMVTSVRASHKVTEYRKLQVYG